MPMYDAEAEYFIPHGYYQQIEADDPEDAEFKIMQEIKDLYEDATSIVVNVKEVIN